MHLLDLAARIGLIALMWTIWCGVVHFTYTERKRPLRPADSHSNKEEATPLLFFLIWCHVLFFLMLVVCRLQLFLTSGPLFQ